MQVNVMYIICKFVFSASCQYDSEYLMCTCKLTGSPVTELKRRQWKWFTI